MHSSFEKSPIYHKTKLKLLQLVDTKSELRILLISTILSFFDHQLTLENRIHDWKQLKNVKTAMIFIQIYYVVYMKILFM